MDYLLIGLWALLFICMLGGACLALWGEPHPYCTLYSSQSTEPTKEPEE